MGQSAVGNPCICLITDDGNAANAATALASALFHTPDMAAYVISPSLSDETRRKFTQLSAALAAEISIIDASHIDLSAFAVRAQWPNVVWLKLYLADLIPRAHDRIVYIDTDVICLTSFTPLFQLDLEGFAFAAVPDIEIRAASDRSRLGIPDHRAYVNCGLMVIDPLSWNERVKPAAIDFALRHTAESDALAFLEQCAINATSWHDVSLLPAEWNVIINFLRKEQVGTLRKSAIVHFAGHKPWNRPDIPGAELYWFFREMTPWKIGTDQTTKSKPKRVNMLWFYVRDGLKIPVYFALGRRRKASEKWNRLSRHFLVSTSVRTIMARLKKAQRATPPATMSMTLQPSVVRLSD